MTSRKEREVAVIALVPGIMTALLQAEGPYWEGGDLLAQEVLEVAASPAEALGGIIIGATSIVAEVCRTFNINAVDLLREIARQRALRSSEDKT